MKEAESIVFIIDDDFVGSRRPNVPSCLILDVRLPGLSGVELHSRLQAGGRSIPTILITAHAGSLADLKPEVLAVFPKPFHPEVLLETVRIAIAQSRR